MALTPDDIVLKDFEHTKFRDGYVAEEVDDYLDLVSSELREKIAEIERLTAENATLRNRVEELEAAAFAQPRPAAGEAVTPEPVPAQVAHTAAAPVVAAGIAAEASKSSGMLQLALELHDKHVREGEEKRDALIQEGELTARELVSDAQKQRAEELARLNGERAQLQNKIKELREFEGDYRSTLRSYIQGQLRGLDGSPEPEGAPLELD